MTYSAVSFLAKKQILRSKKLEGYRHLGELVSRKELKRFSNTYYWASKLAKEYGISKHLLIALLASRGITPVSGPDIDDGSVHIFKKGDVDSLDLTSLIANKSNLYKQLSSKAISKNLDEAQAAGVLGISEKAIRELADRGLIKPHKRLMANNREKGKYWFSLYSIEMYRKKLTDQDGLIAFLAAAKMFGIKPDSFYGRYVRTQRLKPVLMNGKRSENYFRLKDVEGILETGKQTITTQQGARILGVTISGMSSMIVSGILKPISGPAVDGFGINLFLKSDVEKFRAEREAFKEKRIKEGGTRRFGRPRNPRPCPVSSVIGPRIDQLLEEWHKQAPGLHISGYRLYRQLVDEGYKLGRVAVYVYLRQRHQQTA